MSEPPSGLFSVSPPTLFTPLQVEDKYTYNFHWYTSFACPQRPHECLVTDPVTLDQYDLSRYPKWPTPLPCVPCPDDRSF